MIVEGLSIQISTDELRQCLQHRADYHSVKAAFYHKKAELNADLEDTSEQTSNYTNSGIDVVRAARQKVREHRDKARFFRFVAKRLIPHAEYQLDEADLRRFELLEDDDDDNA